MLHKIIAASLLSLVASVAWAAKPVYQSTFSGTQFHIASISVSANEDVMSETEFYDHRDVKQLQSALHKKIMSRLSKNNLITNDGLRLELIITDLKPNRPTLARYRSKPGINFRSIALGGASVEGRFLNAAGEEVGTFNFTWEERWFDQIQGVTTWHDARRAFDRLSRKLVRDLAAQPAS